MRPRSLLLYLSLLPLSSCTRSCKDFDNATEFDQAKLPPYSETGVFTLGCRLGPQVWTVLGSHEEAGSFGYPWRANSLTVEGGYSIPPLLGASGRMTGVRDSKTFYDVGLSLTFLPTDTLGGLRLLGSDSAGVSVRRTPETMRTVDFLTFGDYVSDSRHPVRLRIRKLDRVRRTVSGTFEGCLYARPGGPAGRPDSLPVADGRFDLRY